MILSRLSQVCVYSRYHIRIVHLEEFTSFGIADYRLPQHIHIRISAGKGYGRAIQGIEPLMAILGLKVLKREAKAQGAEPPNNTTEGSRDKGAKGTPVLSIQAILDEEKLAGIVRITVVDDAENEDGQNTAETADNDLKSTPPVEVVDQTEAQDGNGGRG